MAAKKRKACPKGAIVGETIIDRPPHKPEPHFVVYFDRPGRIEVSCSKKGQLIAHVYDGTKVKIDQPPVGGFLLDNGKLTERWVSERLGQVGKVDHDFTGEEGD